MPRLRELGLAGKSAAALWLIMFLAVSARVALQPHRNNVFPTYRLAGEHWLHSQPLYEGAMGFVYSPIVAAVMAPFALLPQMAANVVWRFASMIAFLVALASWRNAELLPRHGWPAVFILLALLALGNLNNGQANLFLIALLLGATAAVRRAHWTAAAFFLAGAGYLKIYPLVLGLLFAVIYPRELGWRLLLAVVVVGLLAFLFHHPSYVAGQYRLWVTTRLADDRLHWDAINAPQDLWRLLRIIHVSEPVYAIIQVASGLGIAILALQGRRRGWSSERLLVSTFALGSAWMVLCGPATESATYILLAPAIVLASVYAFTQPMRNSARLWIALVLLSQLLALALISFTPWRHSPIVLIQPFGALLFFAYLLWWAESSSAWHCE